MSTAIKMKNLTEDWAGEAWLYKLDPPLESEVYDKNKDAYVTEKYGYVVSSAVIALGAPETYIFGANAEGEVEDYLELDGSFKGGLDCDEAIRNAGYEVVRG